MKNILFIALALVTSFAVANTNPLLQQTVDNANLELQVDAIASPNGCSYGIGGSYFPDGQARFYIYRLNGDGTATKTVYNQATGVMTTSTVSEAYAVTRCSYHDPAHFGLA